MQTATIIQFPRQPRIDANGTRISSAEQQARIWGNDVILDNWYHQDAIKEAETTRRT